MTQKELNYVEDIYNHEKLMIETLKDFESIIDDEYKISSMIKEHEKFIESLDDLMEANI